MPKTYYLDNAFLNTALRQITYPSPPTVYVGLFTSTPTVGGGGTEVSGGGYVRQTVTFMAPVNGQVSNEFAVVFPIALSAWGTVTAFGVFDAPSGGNLLYFNTLSVPRSVLVNDQVQFPSGQLIASES